MFITTIQTKAADLAAAESPANPDTATSAAGAFSELLRALTAASAALKTEAPIEAPITETEDAELDSEVEEVVETAFTEDAPATDSPVPPAEAAVLISEYLGTNTPETEDNTAPSAEATDTDTALPVSPIPAPEAEPASQNHTPDPDRLAVHAAATQVQPSNAPPARTDTAPAESLPVEEAPTAAPHSVDRSTTHPQTESATASFTSDKGESPRPTPARETGPTVVAAQPPQTTITTQSPDHETPPDVPKSVETAPQRVVSPSTEAPAPAPPSAPQIPAEAETEVAPAHRAAVSPPTQGVPSIPASPATATASADETQVAPQPASTNAVEVTASPSPTPSPPTAPTSAKSETAATPPPTPATTVAPQGQVAIETPPRPEAAVSQPQTAPESPPVVRTTATAPVEPSPVQQGTPTPTAPAPPKPPASEPPAPASPTPVSSTSEPKAATPVAAAEKVIVPETTTQADRLARVLAQLSDVQRARRHMPTFNAKHTEGARTPSVITTSETTPAPATPEPTLPEEAKAVQAPRADAPPQDAEIADADLPAPQRVTPRNAAETAPQRSVPVPVVANAVVETPPEAKLADVPQLDSVRAEPLQAARPSDPAAMQRTEATAANRPVPETTTLANLGGHAVKSVRYMLSRDMPSMTVRLVPESLGEVRFEVQGKGDDIRIRVESANPAVREAMDRHLPMLRQALAQEGFDVARIDVTPRMAPGSEQGHQPGGRPGGEAAPSGNGRGAPTSQHHAGGDSSRRQNRSASHAGTLDLLA